MFQDFFEKMIEENIFLMKGEEAYNMMMKYIPEKKHKMIELILSTRAESAFVAASNKLNITCNDILIDTQCGNQKIFYNYTTYKPYLLTLTTQNQI